MAPWGFSQVPSLGSCGGTLPRLTHAAGGCHQKQWTHRLAALVNWHFPVHSQSTRAEEPEAGRSRPRQGEARRAQRGAGPGLRRGLCRGCLLKAAGLRSAAPDCPVCSGVLLAASSTRWKTVIRSKAVRTCHIMMAGLNYPRELSQPKQSYWDKSCLWLSLHSKHSSSAGSYKAWQKNPSYITHKIESSSKSLANFSFSVNNIKAVKFLTKM